MNKIQYKLQFLIIFFIFLGCMNITFFYADEFLPIYFSSILLLICLLTVHFLYRALLINLLSYVIFVVFTLPFIHIPGYIFYDFTSKPPFLWGLATNPYMLDESVIKLTAMMGSTGSLGIVAGFLIAGKRGIHKQNLILKSSDFNFARLSLVHTTSLLLIGLIFSVISAPSESVFTSGYTHSETLVQGKGFDSAWMFGYIAITFAYCDAWLDHSRATASLKRKFCIGVILFIIIVLQLMRGDRESLPWIVALLLCPYFCSRIFVDQAHVKIKWRMILIGGLLLLSLNFAVGLMRSSVFGLSPAQTLNFLIKILSSENYSFLNLFSGTWSAVLLTPLSVAGDYINDLMRFKWGLDYWNLILSTPPGFVANWFGYVRPWSGDAGPAWDMRYGIGGTHAIVLPFRNFSMPGVFLIPAIASYLVCRVEVATQKRFSVFRLSLVLTLIMAAPHWLWYGEKNIINALIIYLLFIVVYRMLHSARTLSNKWSIKV